MNKDTNGFIRPFDDLRLVIFRSNDFRGHPGELIGICERGLGRREVAASEVLEMLEGVEQRIIESHAQKMRDELAYIANFKKILKNSTA